MFFFIKMGGLNLSLNPAINWKNVNGLDAAENQLLFTKSELSRKQRYHPKDLPVSGIFHIYV